MIEDLTVEDVMTDEGYRALHALVGSAEKIIEKVKVSFDCDGCMEFECRVAQKCKEADDVEDVLWALIDLMSRELVFGWDLIVDAKVAIYAAGRDYNYLSADLCYMRDQHLVRVGVMKKGKTNAVVYDYPV